jgi:hypothetical protein
MMAFVDPPMAALVITAFSKASRVRTRDGRISSATMATIRCPEAWAIRKRPASTAGTAALPGRLMPRASTMQAIVDAVPIVMQCPCERLMQLSASEKSSSLKRPARNSSERRHTAVPEPRSPPL